MAISKAVTQYAAENGYKFFINGFGYRKLAEITDLEGNHISWTSNTSRAALQAINSLVNQKRLAAKSNEAIATEAEQASQELQPVAAPVVERRFYERPSYMGIGIEVFCGDERYGYALAELLDRPVEVDYTLERQRMDRMMDRDMTFPVFPVYTYDLMRY